MQLSENLPENPKNNPIIILIGGYPGAGKTTLIDALVESEDIAVISWNSIRQALLDRGLRGSPYDWEIIEDVNRSLFSKCLKQRANIVIDANAHPENIKIFESLLEEENYQDVYQIVKICLNPPVETLLARVKARVHIEGFHQGREKDLLRDLETDHKKLNMKDYSLIIKNDEKINFQTEVNIVQSFLKPYFDQQR